MSSLFLRNNTDESLTLDLKFSGEKGQPETLGPKTVAVGPQSTTDLAIAGFGGIPDVKVTVKSAGIHAGKTFDVRAPQAGGDAEEFYLVVDNDGMRIPPRGFFDSSWTRIWLTFFGLLIGFALVLMLIVSLVAKFRRDKYAPD